MKPKCEGGLSLLKWVTRSQEILEKSLMKMLILEKVRRGAALEHILTTKITTTKRDNLSSLQESFNNKTFSNKKRKFNFWGNIKRALFNSDKIITNVHTQLSLRIHEIVNHELPRVTTILEEQLPHPEKK